MQSLAHYRQHGTLPEPGGLNQQPAVWVAATLIATEILDDQPTPE